MDSTQEIAGVGTGSPRERAEIISGELVKLTVKSRHMLPKAANGQHIAPSDPAAANILRDMNSGDSREWFRLYTVGACNIADGVPVNVVTAAARQYIAEMEALAAARERSGTFLRPLGPVFSIETKAQSRLDLAQLKLAESPDSVEALEMVLAEADRYVAPFETMRTACRRMLAVTRGTTRDVVGRRRGALSLRA
jgi:hypothetical protein